MTKDLVVSRWQVRMAADPTRDPDAVLKECQEYWSADVRQDTIAALALHQGSLDYPDPTSLEFRFNLSLTEARQRIASAK